jgi:hypothetical protein
MRPRNQAIVVSGRSEGESMRRCLTSALRECEQMVYVDSSSTDGSPSLARSLDAPVVQLETNRQRRRQEGGFKADLIAGEEPELSLRMGAVLPISAGVRVCSPVGASLLVASFYPALALRMYLRMRGRHLQPQNALLYACYCVAAKFPQVLARIRFLAGRWGRSPGSLIEYKST